ncbi:hypothetical protein C0J52_07670 [Blattella germanica]|nr:hypothetical protein C0J52_07670 [Blattella germanica]
MKHMPRPGRPSVSEEYVEAVSALLDIDRQQTVRELAMEICLSHMTVFRILKTRLKILQRYGHDGDIFLRRIISLDETWLGHTSLYLSINPMSGVITGHHARQWCVVPLKMSK